MTVTPTQQGLRLASVRAVTGTTLDHDGDWLALFDAASIAAGDFNGRFLAWLNLKLSATYTSLPQAMQALADANSVFNFSSLGTFDASTVPTAPVNTVAPAIVGPATVGSLLTVSNGTWTQSPTGYTYAWKKDGVANGTTTQTYTPVVGDIGSVLTCDVTATNATGSTTQGSNSLTAAAALAITNSPGTTATVGSAYTYSPTTSGGRGTKVWSIVNTPSWAAFSTSTGILTGTPSGAETDTGINITVTDADGRTASTGAFTITVSAVAPFSFPLLFMGY